MKRKILYLFCACIIITGVSIADSNRTKTIPEKVSEVKEQSKKIERVIINAPPEPPAGYSRPVVKRKPWEKVKNNK